MFCPNCGSPLPEEAKFCGTCGTPVAAVPTPTLEIPTPNPAPAVEQPTPSPTPTAETPTSTPAAEIPTPEPAPAPVFPEAPTYPGAAAPEPGVNYGDPGNYNSGNFGNSFNTNTSYTAPEPSYVRPLLTYDRSILVYILLTIVTCGIYRYFFVHNISKEVNVSCDGDGETTSGVLAFIFLGLVTCGIYDLWWFFKINNRIARAGQRYGLTIQENGTTWMVWTLAGSLFGVGSFIADYYMIKNLNAVNDAYNRSMLNI